MSTTADPRTDVDRRLPPLERLGLLLDAGPIDVIRSHVQSPTLGPKARDGDGVVGALGRVDGRTVLCYAEDASFAGGSLGQAHADTIVRVLELAERARAPVVALGESAGARLQDGVAALDGYARIFRHNVRLSGLVPQISVLTGVSAGGGSYSPALTDFVVMTRGACAFLTGPEVVRETVGEEVSRAELGGPRVQQSNGVCHLVTDTTEEAIALARELLGYLPQNAWEPPPIAASIPPRPGDPGAWLPAQSRAVYDIRSIIATLVDGGELLEIAPRWARNLVTGLCRMMGRPVGVIANQPRYLGGVLDVDAAQKGARFVRTCNAFGLPILALVDTPGFLPGSKQEAGGVIRHGAKLVHAFAETTVPTISVVLRKAYGGAYISMNAKGLGADFAFAWPDAEIGIMAPRQAVRIVNRRDLVDADELAHERLARSYAEEHVDARAAVRRGYVDELIETSSTRARVVRALAALDAIRDERQLRGKNIPL